MAGKYIRSAWPTPIVDGSSGASGAEEGTDFGDDASRQSWFVPCYRNSYSLAGSTCILNCSCVKGFEFNESSVLGDQESYACAECAAGEFLHGRTLEIQYNDVYRMRRGQV